MDKLIPQPYGFLVWLAAYAVLVAGLFGYGWITGAEHVQEKWDAAKAQQTIQIAQIGQRQAETTAKVVTEYVDRVKIVREKGADIIKEVPVYVPSDACDLPGGFRVLHDAAATNTLPDPARIADARPVAAQDAASTIADNYERCHENAEQLKALQTWIIEQEKVGAKPD